MKLNERFAKVRLKVVQYKNMLIGNRLTEKGMRYYKYLTNIVIDENYEPQNYEEMLFEEAFSTATIKYNGTIVANRHDKALIGACHLAPMYPPKQFWSDPDLLKCVGI